MKIAAGFVAGIALGLAALGLIAYIWLDAELPPESATVDSTHDAERVAAQASGSKTDAAGQPTRKNTLACHVPGETEPPADREGSSPDQEEPIDAREALPDLPADVAQRPDPASSASGTPPTSSVPPPDKHFVFWEPFTTRASARGFAASVSEKSGVPVEVVDAAEGYRVAIRYASEEELAVSLDAIERATRLRLDE